MDSICYREVLVHLIRYGNEKAVREWSELFESLDFSVSDIPHGARFAFRSRTPPYSKTDPPQAVTPIALAAGMGNLKLVRFFIEVGASPDHIRHDGYTALELATSEGHLNIIKFLLGRSDVADPLAQSWSASKALKLAAARGDLIMMRLLIEHGADANQVPL
ncbi:ankyrin repeat-containing domain protein [Nemania serpens]|nr:ankyrin repeat-containing domain protein [Nemania serpens]